jgi:uncharacterized protein YndB with AHSA1/START domain
MRIERSISIALPPESVWEFVADPRNDPRWCPKVDSVVQVEGDGPGGQARYLVRHRPKPLRGPVDLTMVAVEFDPPRRLRWREEDGDAVFDVTYEVEPEGSGTRMTQIDDIEWKVSRLVQPIGRAMVSRDIQRQLQALRALLEAPSG